MDNNFVSDLLKDWGLEELVDEFDRQKIDRESFLTIPEEGIKQLIPLVGWRYTFLRKREEYLMKNMPKDDATSTSTSSNLLDENITSEDISEFSTEQVKKTSENKSDGNSNEFKGQELRTLLQTNLVGRYLLKKDCLDASDRCDLVRIIIEHQMLIAFKIKKETLNYWADQIVSVFKKEKRETYYIPYKKDESVASGKLYDKFTNLRRKLLAINLKENKDNEQVTTPLNTLDVDKLKNVSIENHEEIKDLWLKTHSFRMVEIKEVESISCYFEKYPMLTNPIGTSLINLDFITLCDEKLENIFIKTWPDLSHKIVQVAQKKKAPKNILREIDSDASTEIKGLILLPYLFRPTQTKSENGKRWTPTYKEQADSFILFIDHMNDLQKTLEDRIKQLRKHRNSSQPFIIAVGNPKKIDACYVIIETVKYKFLNIFAAVDLCFKSFFSLNLKYPVESKLAWIFIERKIYGLSEELKNPPAISSLFSDLESVKVDASESEESSS